MEVNLTRLSLAMIVKNEESRLARCLDSVKGLVDELIVVDTGSTDRTKAVATDYGAKVFDFMWVNDFSIARNFSLQNSSGDWNLVLDADEYVIDGCQRAIREFTTSQQAIGRLRRLDKFLQNGEEKYAQAFISRLMPKGTIYEGQIHEQVISTLPRVIVKADIGHDGYFGVDKSGRNLSMLLSALKKNPNDPYMLFQTGTQYHLSKDYGIADKYFAKCYDLIPQNEAYRPEMIVRYIYNTIGHGNLTRGLELFQREKNVLAGYTDFHFVSGILFMELAFKDTQKYINLFPSIEAEYLLCLEIGEDSTYNSVIGTGSFYPLYNLGVYHEVMGNITKAKDYYTQALRYNYQPAQLRLNSLR